MTRLPMLDPLAEIRRLYFATTRATIEGDFARALDLLKMMESEDDRSRATVFMHGLAQMRADWGKRPEAKPRPAPGPKAGEKRRSAERPAHPKPPRV